MDKRKRTNEKKKSSSSKYYTENGQCSDTNTTRNQGELKSSGKVSSCHVTLVKNAMIGNEICKGNGAATTTYGTFSWTSVTHIFITVMMSW